MAFEKRDNRQQNKTNIYLKNLPALEEAELTNLIKTKLAAFGNISSILVKKDTQIQKPFAFVCFSEAAQAQKAFEWLEENNLGTEDKIYVNWA